MKVKPASVHFLANVGFSLNCAMSAFIRQHYAWFIQSRNPDVCPDILALSRSVLCDLRRDMRRGHRDLQRMESSRHAVTGRPGQYTGWWFGCHILKLFGPHVWQFILAHMSLSNM
jgi:hypothetical protein